MQMREPSALTRNGCWEAPAASLARMQNGRGAGLGGGACAAAPRDGEAAGERRYRTQVGGAGAAGGRLSRLSAGPGSSPRL